MSNRAGNTPTLEDIYAPVRDDLAVVEARFRAVGNVADPALAELLGYALRGGGKRIRPTLALLSARLYEYDLERLMPAVLAVEMMHLATLVHDDTIDDSALRWGRATVNKLWGMDQAVLLGDYLFAQAGGLMAATDNLRLIKLFSETLMIISAGEIAQARSSFSLNQTRQQYFRRIFSKTASLFRLATISGAVMANAPEAGITCLGDYGRDLGVEFQIVDDILDFVGSEEEMGKPVGADLTQGTLTLPAMLLHERNPEDNPVKRLFEGRGGQEHVAEAIRQVRDSSIIEECLEVARQYRDRACHHLEDLPDGDARRSLCYLADFILSRRR